MPKVLFICYGNVARSQMAEGYYNHFTNSHDGTSASTEATTPYRYNHPDRIATEVMREDGIDISGNKVKHVTEDMVNMAEKVIILNKKSDCPYFVQSSNKVTY